MSWEGKMGEKLGDSCWILIRGHIREEAKQAFWNFLEEGVDLEPWFKRESWPGESMSWAHSPKIVYTEMFSSSLENSAWVIVYHSKIRVYLNQRTFLSGHSIRRWEECGAWSQTCLHFYHGPANLPLAGSVTEGVLRAWFPSIGRATIESPWEATQSRW